MLRDSTKFLVVSFQMSPKSTLKIVRSVDLKARLKAKILMKNYKKFHAM